MSVLLVCNGAVPAEFLPGAEQQNPCKTMPPGFVAGNIVTANGRILTLESPSVSPSARLLDASSCTVLPGFVDVHVHGGAGADVMDASPSALATLAEFLASHGVTTFLPTTMTAPHSNTLLAVRAVAQFNRTRQAGARAIGVHLEGPYISPQFPGAQPASFIRPPNPTELAELLAAGPVRMITLAPEAPGAPVLIHQARAQNVVVVMGHTNATYADCLAAVERGVSQATHTYNAMRGLHHREPGALGAVLNHDAIDAQLIADNIHVHPAAMHILARCKGVERTLLISDAIRATGLAPGVYDLGGQTVTVRDGECRLADGTLAGSLLTLERALANFITATGLPLAAAWPAASRTPARTLGLAHEIGSLAPGYRADLVLLDANLAVVATIIHGEIAYLREPERLHNG